MSIAENIRKRRVQLDMTLDDVAKVVGVSRQTLSRYETGVIGNIPSDKIELIAKALRVSPAYIMGWEDLDGTSLLYSASNIEPLPGFVNVPLLGDIACGDPIIAIEDADEFVSMPDTIRADFALRCKGDSMINARIFDGDIVYIRAQSTVDDKEIAAVLVDDEATLKRVLFFDDHIVLAPENPMYKPLVYWGEEMNSVRILGKAVAFTSTVR